MKTLTTPKTRVSLLEENILENFVAEGAFIDTEDIYALKEANMQLAGDSKYGVLVEAGYLSAISDEARKLTASAEFQQNTIAKALIVHSTAQKLVGQFYLRVNKPAIKTKLFTSREEALNWLRSVVGRT